MAEQRLKTITILAAVLLACQMSVASAPDVKPETPTKPSSYPVKLTMRDGTTVYGEMVGFAGGCLELKTRRGTLTVAANLIREITVVKTLPPAPAKCGK